MMRAIVLAGPTGAGKSRIAVEVAKRLDGEVVSADSRQIYRDLRIGTARLNRDQMGGVPHHLMGFLDPAEPYSAGRFAAEAHAIIMEMSERGKVPLICGGTGFYIKALLDGLFDEAAVVEDRARLKEIRSVLGQRLKEVGSDELHRRLKCVDPDSAERIHPNDAQRILRALEMFELTGVPLSLHHRRGTRRREITAYKVCLSLERKKLYETIDRRVEVMFESGFVEEVKELMERGYGKDAPAFKGIGYEVVIRHLDGSIDRQEAIRLVKRETRHYAKRQLTWFQREDGYRWVVAGGGAVSEIVRGWQHYVK